MIETAKTRYSDHFHFYSGDMFVGNSIKHYGEYTQVEIDHMAPYINSDSVIYDIGGNIGYHATAFASMAKEVHSFEPNNKNFALLEMNLDKFDNAYLYNCAASFQDGETFISDYSLEEEGNYGKCEIVAEGQHCKTFKIDSLNMPPPDLIKIDVEGFELNVIVGAGNTIATAKPVIFYESMHGTGFDTIYDFLTGLDYKIYWTHAYNFNEHNFNKNDVNIFANSGVINCLAVPADKPQPDLPEMLDRADTSDAYVGRMVAAGKMKVRT